MSPLSSLHLCFEANTKQCGFSKLQFFLDYKALCNTALNELHDNSDDEKNCCGEVKNFELLTSVKSQAKI